MLIKKLLKKHKYPPEGMEDAVQTVMLQCELWTDNNDMEKIVPFTEHRNIIYEDNTNYNMVAEETVTYSIKKE